MDTNIRTFYDSFSKKFINDFIYGNLRIKKQLFFLKKSVPKTTDKILVIGCGIGQSAHFITKRIAKKAKILAVDISPNNIRIANVLYNHKHIEFRKLDIITDPIENDWDIIVLPDVYEHFPLKSREKINSKLNRILNTKGKLLITVPSPAYQKYLHATGNGLQVVDEIVTLEDFLQLANKVNGIITYFNIISVWNTNDYIHVIIERGADEIEQINDNSTLPINGWEYENIFFKLWRLLILKLKIINLFQKLRLIKIKKIYKYKL